MIDQQTLLRAVSAALDEDLGAGDITSEAVLPAGIRARARIVARHAMVVSGIEVARAVFRRVDAELAFTAAHTDGDVLDGPTTLARIEGRAAGILTGERTALNFLQRMSGIATATRRAVERSGASVAISDTRKTAPGLRAFDKEAVRAGGGASHRAGLFDAILIKDNHWRLCGGIAAAVRNARQARGADESIEVEVGSLDELQQALETDADAVLLDNMDEGTLRRAVSMGRGRAFLEISGGVTEENVARLAALGVDRISMGSLTHSVRTADIALEIDPA